MTIDDTTNWSVSQNKFIDTDWDETCLMFGIKGDKQKYFGKWADWDNENAFVIKILNCVWQVTASHFYDDIVEFEYVTNNELEALSWKTTLLNDQFKVYYEVDIILSGLFSMKIPSILKKLNISIY